MAAASTAANTPKTTTSTRRRPAKTATAKAAAPAAEKATPATEETSAEKLVITLEYLRDTTNFAVFTFPADVECKGNVYVPMGTAEVKVQLIAE